MSGESSVPGDANPAVRVLYRSDGLSDALLSNLAQRRTKLGGWSVQSDGRGLCSRIYRLRSRTSAEDGDGTDENEELGDDAPLCVKRVMEDDQVAPHSVAREVSCYRIIWDACRDESQRSMAIMPLIAAFYDSADEFDVMTDLVMPFYPCTLQDILDESTLVVGASDRSGHAIQQSSHARLSEQIIQALDSIDTFAFATIFSLFSALAFLHGKDIAHRDVKPSNILLRPSDGQAQLIDFGTSWLPTSLYPPGDNGRGGMASEVGTGCYRAPECLLSPRNGYDAAKVDIWQAGVTLMEFFLPLRAAPARSKAERPHGLTKKRLFDEVEDEEAEQADQLEWERALWAQDKGQAWSALRDRFDEIEGHAPTFYQHGHPEDDDDDEEVSHVEPSSTGWRREQLFGNSEGSGDLSLANAIFTLCGLPNGDADGEAQWPEAVHFQPALAALPFKRRLPSKGGIRARVTKEASTSEDRRIQACLDVLSECIQLSASGRISAEQAVARLNP